MVYRVLSKLKWVGGLEDCEIVILHRGAPGNRKTIPGKDVTEVKKSYFYYKNKKETCIPLHRVLEVRLKGKVIWKSAKEDAAQATPVPFQMGGRQCVAVFSGYGIVGVDSADGTRLWGFPWDTKYKTNVADPIIADDKVFISTWYGMGCALLDIAAGKPEVVWQHKEMRNHYSSCVLWKGYLYGFDVDKLKCMDFKTGRVKWTLKEGFGRGSLMLADGKLIVLTEKGTLMIGDASPKQFRPVLKAKIIKGKCFTGPVFSGGKIYARNISGDLTCVVLNRTKSEKKANESEAQQHR